MLFCALLMDVKAAMPTAAHTAASMAALGGSSSQKCRKRSVLPVGLRCSRAHTVHATRQPQNTWSRACAADTHPSAAIPAGVHPHGQASPLAQPSPCPPAPPTPSSRRRHQVSLCPFFHLSVHAMRIWLLSAADAAAGEALPKTKALALLLLSPLSLPLLRAEVWKRSQKRRFWP